MRKPNDNIKENKKAFKVYQDKRVKNSEFVKNYSNNLSENPKHIKYAIAKQAIISSSYDKSNNKYLEETTLYISQTKKTTKRLRFFYFFSVVVFGCTIYISAQSFILNKQAKDQIGVLAEQSDGVDAQGVAQGDGNNPAEQFPGDSALYSYQVEPRKPRYLRIPSINVFSRVKELGTTRDGAVDAPWNVHDVGWYNGSVIPGSISGVSLILGHVSGRVVPGVFKSINNLNAGDIIQLEKGNGEIINYSVEKIEEYAVESIDMAKILYEVDKGTQSLRLMTCSGVYDNKTEDYKSRTVVFAKPIE
jgi:LPXTG-site transpeptidase (sortase) family protein